MDKKDLMIIGGIAGSIVLLFVVLFIIYCRVEQQSVVLILTAGVVSWYAWETREMRKEVVHQTIIQSTPFISILIETNPYKFMIRNDGEGTARKINLKILKPHIEDIFSHREDVLISFKTVEILPKSEKSELKIENIFDKQFGSFPIGSILDSAYIQDLIGRSQLYGLFFKLKFENILYKSYHAEVVFKDDEFHIIDFGKI